MIAAIASDVRTSQASDFLQQMIVNFSVLWQEETQGGLDDKRKREKRMMMSVETVQSAVQEGG